MATKTHTSTRTSRKGRALILPVLTVLASGIGAWWIFPPDPGDVLRAERAPLARVERTTAPELGKGAETWRLIDARGDTVLARWQPAPRGTRNPWTVVMMAGVQTGERALLLLPRSMPANVLAVNWPWSGPRRLSPWDFVKEHLAIRSAVLRSPAALALGIEALGREPGVTRSRIALLGASIGVAPALAALELTDVPGAVVLVDGAADIECLMRHVLAGHVRPALARALLAAYGARLVFPLEPALHLDKAARIPTLVLSAVSDERLPAPAIDALLAGMPAANVVMHGGGHILPERPALIRELTNEIVRWLDGLGAGTSGRGPAPTRVARRRVDATSANALPPPTLPGPRPRARG